MAVSYFKVSFSKTAPHPGYRMVQFYNRVEDIHYSQITEEPYLQWGDDHQSPSVNNTPLSFTWVHILNMTWSAIGFTAICVEPLLFTCIGLGSQSASSPWAIPPRRASKRGEPLRASPEGLPTMAREDITAALVWPSSPQPSSGCTWIERSGVLEILFLD